MDDEQLAAAWLENCRDAIAFGADSEEADATFRAYSALDRLCSVDPAKALEIIRLILALKPEERVVYNLAAGPMEDLLVRHGMEVIDRVDQIANQEEAFLEMLAGVWPERMSPEIRTRIQPLIERAELSADRPSRLS